MGEIPVVLTEGLTIESFIIGYQVNRMKWRPFNGEVLCFCMQPVMQPDSRKDNYEVAIRKGPYIYDV